MSVTTVPNVTGEAQGQINAAIVGATSGSVLFAVGGGALSQNNASFFWDNTNLICKLTQDASFLGYYQIKGCGQTVFGGQTSVFKATPTDGYGTASNYVDFNLRIVNHGNLVAGRGNVAACWGWNTGWADLNFRENTAKSAIYNQYESFYHPDSGNTLQEWHVVWVNPAGTFYARPFTTICDEVTNNITCRIQGNEIDYKLPDGGAGGTGTLFALMTPYRTAWTPQPVTTGTPNPGFEFTFGSHTGLTAAQAHDILINGRTITFATGTFADQNFFNISAQTVAFSGGAGTITTASTFTIAGPPQQGANCTLTTSYALRVKAGLTGLEGNLRVGSATDTSGTGDFVTGLTGGARMYYQQSVGLACIYGADSNTAGIILGNKNATTHWQIYQNVSAGSAQGSLNFRDMVGSTTTLTLSTGGHIIVGASGKNLGFFGGAGTSKGTRGATFTNNITSGGTTDSPANWTDLTTYANDAAAIRNAIYQLARVINQYDVALRAYGLVT